MFKQKVVTEPRIDYADVELFVVLFITWYPVR